MIVVKAALASTLALVLALVARAADSPAPDLQGLWAATLRFGPDIRGTLIILRTQEGWRGDIAGFSVPVRTDGQAVSFELPDGKGSFRGRLSGKRIVGHWIQARSEDSGLAYASPVMLEAAAPGRWRGAVAPLAGRFRFYMPVLPQPGGGFRTYLRNPERNLGWFVPVSRMTLKGEEVSLIGRRGGQSDTTLAQGRYQDDMISIRLRGGMYDFTRVSDPTSSPFYPRGNPAARYRYAPPVQRDDGWPVATVDEVGISRGAIERFVQMLIDMPMDSMGTLQVHSFLIARHGKLVVEEYFHGYHRDMPHDTRSAAKSWTAVLLGAAMQAGVPIGMGTPVYETMLGTLGADLDPRKRAMTLEHLVSMTAGYDCDDRNPSAPGAEDVMQSQTKEPDWYRYTLNVPLTSAPGEKLVYCSAESNLAGGVLAKVANEPLPELFDRLVARPLEMGTYHLLLTPTGEAYGGGGHHFLPRDFMKLAQLMVNGGKWRGRQVLSTDWVQKSSSPLRDLSPIQQYGYLWNSVEYPFGSRKVRAFFAGGNGGQIFMGVPELDLVVAFTGGNYNHPALFIPQRVFVPQYLLPAVTDAR